MERAPALPHRHQRSNPFAADSPKQRKNHVKLIAAVVITAAALLDWSRPAPDQWSVRLYDLAVIKSYRALLHPITSKVTRCRFRPTCSRYSQEAMHARGFPEGLLLTFWRIMRCGPWVKPGTRDDAPH